MTAVSIIFITSTQRKTIGFKNNLPFHAFAWKVYLLIIFFTTDSSIMGISICSVNTKQKSIMVYSQDFHPVDLQ